MSKLRVGVVGGGSIAHAHLPSLQEHAEVELTALVDVNAETAKQTAEQYGIARTAADYKEIVDEVDAVVICVPTFLHADIADFFLRAGKAVFCEKPMTRTIEQAEKMLKAAQESGSPLQVGFVRRFDAEWMAFREAVQAGKIGRPAIWRDVAAGTGPLVPWFNQDEKGGGPFLDGCIHNIDFALSMYGPAQWAFCHGRTLREGSTAIDSGTATVHFQSGDELLLAWSWGLPPGCNGNGVFQLFGARGILQRGEDENGEAAFIINKGDEAGKETLSYPPNALGTAFKEQMDEFVEVAQRKKEPRAGGKEGLESLRVAEAILQSARSGQVVNI